MSNLVYLIENRRRGPIAGSLDDWRVDESTPVMTDSRMAGRQAEEWNADYPDMMHRPALYTRVKETC